MICARSYVCVTTLSIASLTYSSPLRTGMTTLTTPQSGVPSPVHPPGSRAFSSRIRRSPLPCDTVSHNAQQVGVILGHVERAVPAVDALVQHHSRRHGRRDAHLVCAVEPVHVLGRRQRTIKQPHPLEHRLPRHQGFHDVTHMVAVEQLLAKPVGKRAPWIDEELDSTRDTFDPRMLPQELDLLREFSLAPDVVMRDERDKLTPSTPDPEIVSIGYTASDLRDHAHLGKSSCNVRCPVIRLSVDHENFLRRVALI